jgi:hypothetical protein
VQSEQLFRDSLEIAQELGNAHYTAHALEGLAALALVATRPGRTMRLAGAAAALRHPVDAPKSPADEAQDRDWLKRAEALLGSESSAATSAEGHAMSLGQAVAYALDEEWPHEPPDC